MGHDLLYLPQQPLRLDRKGSSYISAEKQLSTAATIQLGVGSDRKNKPRYFPTVGSAFVNETLIAVPKTTMVMSLHPSHSHASSTEKDRLRHPSRLVKRSGSVKDSFSVVMIHVSVPSGDAKLEYTDN